MLPENFVKCSFILFCYYQLVSTEVEFRAYNTFPDYKDVPIDDPEGLINAGSAYFDASKPTQFIAIGFNYKEFGPLLSALVPALLEEKHIYNVVLVNWVKEASDGGMGLLGYLYNALPNSKRVGKLVGSAIVNLVNGGVNKNITFIAHSLGAQMAGYAGRQAIEGGYSFTQIFAMDAARRGYENSLTYKSVDVDCGTFVIQLHCDLGGYGVNNSLGHVNFFANSKEYIIEGGTRLQPGCSKSYTAQEIATDGNMCSHDRCWKLFIESLRNRTGFVGGLAKTYYDWASKNGVFSTVNCLGPNTDPKLPGNYFFNTNAADPYAMGTAGLYPN